MEADVVALNAECGRCGRLVARCQCLYPDPHRAFRDREDGWDELMAMLDRPARVLPALKELMAGVRLDEPWTERALRAEQRVRDLEEAQGELLGLLDAEERRVSELRRQAKILRAAVDLVMKRIARGDFAVKWGGPYA